VNITFEWQEEGELDGEAWLEPYELSMMFEQTRQDLTHALERKLAGVTCAEHGDAPRIHIIGKYDYTNEQMDVSYHVDTCCKLFLLRVVQILHHVG
jgi:hypothetical protein